MEAGQYRLRQRRVVRAGRVHAALIGSSVEASQNLVLAGFFCFMRRQLPSSNKMRKGHVNAVQLLNLSNKWGDFRGDDPVWPELLPQSDKIPALNDKRRALLLKSTNFCRVV